MAKAKEIIRVAAISGDEHLFRRREVAEAVEIQQKAGWEVDIIDGSLPGAIPAALGQGGLFGDDNKMVIVVRNAGKSDLKVIKEHAAEGDPELVLLLDVEGKPKGNTKFGRFLKDLGKAHREFNKPAEWKLEEYATEFCMREMGTYDKILDRDKALLLVQYSGTDLGTLSYEVLKIAMLMGPGDPTKVEVAHLKGAIAPLAETPVEQVKQAVMMRNRLLVVNALRRVRKTSKTDPTIMVTRTLGAVLFSWLELASYVEQGMSSDEIADVTGQNAWYVKNKVLPRIRNWTVGDLKKAICSVAYAERAVFKGLLDPWTLLTVGLARVCR
jgi:DNA polymerase III delta subunit